MKLITAEQMKELDRRAIEEYGIPSIVLMENAGIAGYKAAMEMLDGIGTPTVLVMCGPGNNGGDGYVVARHLYNAGIEVSVAHIGSLDAVKGDASTNMEIVSEMGIDIYESPEDDDLVSMAEDADLIVDALLGTGSRGAARGKIQQAIIVANISLTPILSLDIPSGIDVDSGGLPGECILADTTITFGLPKVGLASYPAAQAVGRLIVEEISIPSSAIEELDAAAIMMTENVVSSFMPFRPADSHKGSCGHLAVVAGSTGMSGAAVLSCLGGLRIGSGLVTAFVPESINQIFEVKVTEAMSVPVAEGEKGAFGKAAVQQVLDKSTNMDAAVIGPGVGRSQETIDFVRGLIETLNCPLVLDADALFAVSKDLSILRKAKREVVITPHPGEMAMLLGTTVSEVQSNRIEVARQFAQQYGVIVVLKGAGTVIAGAQGEVYVNTTGCAGMATGGAGDVLSGMIGGLIVQGVWMVEAASAAVFLHGLAGMTANNKLGELAMLAGDIADNIGEAVSLVNGTKHD